MIIHSPAILWNSSVMALMGLLGKTHESLPFTNAFYGIFTSWIREMKPKDSENVLSGAPGYDETDLPATFLLSLRDREEGGKGKWTQPHFQQ